MRVATLIVNPTAGRAHALAAQFPSLEACLQHHGYTSRVVTTTAEPASATNLAGKAAEDSDLVIACGGDGTIHQAIQSLAHTGIPLGILPLGTHNALAFSLNLPTDPVAALTRLLTFTARLIPLGRITTAHHTRFFITMAGAGPSGALAKALAARTRGKARLGRAIYPLRAAGLFATSRWPSFRIDYRLPRSTTWHTLQAASLLVSRIPSLGGLFSRLTPGASLTSSVLHAYVLPAPLHVTVPAWFATSFTGLPNPWLQQIEAEQIRCTPLTSRPILTQADAEPLGSLPCTLSIAPTALNLLMPSR